MLVRRKMEGWVKPKPTAWTLTYSAHEGASKVREQGTLINRRENGPSGMSTRSIQHRYNSYHTVLCFHTETRLWYCTA